MQDFIVLGIVPGTQIQLSFIFWLYVGTGFFSLLCIVHFARRHSLRNYIAGLRIARTIDDYELIGV